jgi:hypothetical protein
MDGCLRVPAAAAAATDVIASGVEEVSSVAAAATTTARHDCRRRHPVTARCRVLARWHRLAPEWIGLQRSATPAAPTVAAAAMLSGVAHGRKSSAPSRVSGVGASPRSVPRRVFRMEKSEGEGCPPTTKPTFQCLSHMRLLVRCIGASPHTSSTPRLGSPVPRTACAAQAHVSSWVGCFYNSSTSQGSQAVD